ncbi:hypothetical protein [Streptomyces sp. NPDC057686]|uniref:hypothetical protein n=1 Tax=Streptomyces sp. NPDC057686 TaxID=3346212 RepID=UPI0036CC47F4
MVVSELVRAELRRVDWASLKCGCGDSAEHAEGAGLGDRCRHHAQEGFWGLVHIGLTGTAEDAETVADICEYFKLGGDKAAFYQAELRERMRAKTKRGRRV